MGEEEREKSWGRKDRGVDESKGKEKEDVIGKGEECSVQDRKWTGCKQDEESSDEPQQLSMVESMYIRVPDIGREQLLLHELPDIDTLP